MYISLILIAPIFIYFINKYLQLRNFIPSLSGDKHQSYVGKESIPLSGGLFIILSVFIIFITEIKFSFIFFLVVFLIGFFSDLRKLNSPRTRFILQFLTIFFFVFLNDLSISNTRVFFLDYILDYKIISYLFVTFCLLIVINGSNFIDGLNGLTLGYFFSLLLILFNLAEFKVLISNDKILICLFIMTYLILFNFFNKLYLGDNGSYLLGFIFGTLLIILFKNTENISPFFIILLLWYPCYENLFSIIRKYKLSLSPLKPDNKHFHQLLYYFLKKKFNLSNILSNNLSSIIINIFNLSILYIGSKDIYNGQFQVSLISVNIFLYTFLYLRFFEFRFAKKN